MRFSALRKKFGSGVTSRVTPESFTSRRISRGVKVGRAFRTFGSATASGASTSAEAIRKFRENRAIRQEEKRQRQTEKEEREIAKLQAQVKLQELRKKRQLLKKKTRKRFVVF